MKRSFLLFLFIAAAGWTIQAQRPPIKHDPERIAQMQTDMLDKELSLTKKQRKKVYKLYLKQAHNMQAETRPGNPGDMAHPPMMGGGGMGGGRGSGMGRRQHPPSDGNVPTDTGAMPGNKQMIHEASPEEVEVLEKK